MSQKKLKNGAQLLLNCLENENVNYVFGIPGAALMPILDEMVDHKIKFVVCRHEQNAALIAQAWGRVTGQPGVCMATAGPGATNLVTGVAAATQDRDPLVAITGQVPHRERFKKSHQNINTVSMFEPVTKWSFDISQADHIPESVANAFRVSKSPREGATHLSIPFDIANSKVDDIPIKSHNVLEMQVAKDSMIKRAESLIRKSKSIVVLLGVGASKKMVTSSVRKFLKKTQYPVVGTFEAAGSVSRDLEHLFVGRIGIKITEAGDLVLGKADLVISIGYDPIEYDPLYWNKNDVNILHIDEIPAVFDSQYDPEVELVGDIADNLKLLSKSLRSKSINKSSWIDEFQQIILEQQAMGAKYKSKPIHPMRFIHDMRNTISDDVTVISDVGCHQLWLAKYFYSYEPRHLLFSMGSQTMGVALPWAIGVALARPNKKVISVSGDGSFMMSSMELETAVRLNLPIIHIIWKDGTYNLVEIQQMAKYGRSFATKFGNIDFVKFSKSFGAKAFQVKSPNQINSILKKSLKMKGPVVLEVPIDYKDNIHLIESVHDQMGNY